MQSRYQTNTAYLQDIAQRKSVQFFPKAEYDPHGDSRDEKPVPHDHAFIQCDQPAQYTRKPGEKNSDMKLQKSLFHVAAN